MPLPFILGGIAIAAAGFGAKKGYDGYQDKSLADDILKAAKSKYEVANTKVDNENQVLQKNLEKLGSLQLQIGSEFKEFRKMADELLAKINKTNHTNIDVKIPQYQLDKIKQLEMSTTAFLGKVTGAGVGGAAAAYAVYGGVMAFAAASTGTAISSLSGIAAYNATLAAIGGGSLAAGGFGMAGGMMVLGSVVAAPIVAIAGWAFSSYAEDALNDARKTRDEVDKAVKKMELAAIQLRETDHYVTRIYTETNKIHQSFKKYFNDLKNMHTLLTNGSDISKIDNEAILVIQNGYKLAAILTDIITTPLFKPKLDSNKKIVTNKEGVIEFALDKNDMQILNKEDLDTALTKGSKEANAV